MNYGMPGKLKSENKWFSIEEFVALRPKQYSYVTEDDEMNRIFKKEGILTHSAERDLINFQFYLYDSLYDYTIEEMIKFYNDYRAMYAQRYFMREGLIYYGQDEYEDDRHIDIQKVVWRKKKDYNGVELSAEEYLQRTKAKL